MKEGLHRAWERFVRIGVALAAGWTHCAIYFTQFCGRTSRTALCYFACSCRYTGITGVHSHFF